MRSTDSAPTDTAAGAVAMSEAPLVLATDLDGTFAGGTAQDRARLLDVLEARGALLLYVTGRSVAAARALRLELGLPLPDLLIADVGTSVVRGEDDVPVDALEAEILERWPGREAVRARLEGTPGITEQDVHPPRRVSYWLTDEEMEAALARVERRVEGLGVDVIGSAGQYVDVLPGGVNKGSTLLRVLDWLGQDAGRAVVAGDTLNDLALFETGLRGIVVGNAEPELKRRVGGRPRVYLAEARGAAGILEGLERFARAREEDDGE